jgi:hypothetical protein
MEDRYYEKSVPGYEPVEEITKDYIPKRQEILREYEIGIRFLSIGCVIRVGCKEIPFTDVDDAMTELSNYVSNPYEEGKKWQEIFKEQG